MSQNQKVSLLEASRTENDNWFSPRNEVFPYHEVYRRLDSTRNEIRLVHLLPGAEEDPIACRLQSDVLLNVPPREPHLAYEALSYCAGDPTDCCQISLNGYSFNVFRSLHGALRRFRWRHEERTMWVDLLCINQTDIPERDSQVLMMRTIYESGTGTLVWLGDGAPDNDAAFDLIDDFVSNNREDLHQVIKKFDQYEPEYFQSDRKQLGLFNGDLADYLESEELWTRQLVSRQMATGERKPTPDPALRKACCWVEDAGNNESLAKAWSALAEILERPWWKRCWIVQEVAVSDRLLVNCGSRCAIWEDLSLMATVVAQSKSLCSSYLRTPKVEPWAQCALLSALRRDSLRGLLLSNLMATQGFLASDARDNVYATLGLLSRKAKQAYGISPSYAASNKVSDVFITASKAGILVEHSYLLFSAISGRESDVGLPSWVPDWTGKNISGNLYVMRDFRAGGTWIAAPKFLEHDRVMQVSGVILDSINTLGQLDKDTVQAPMDTINSWVRLLPEVPSNLRLVTLDTFFRTIFMELLDCSKWPDPHGDPGAFVKFWAKEGPKFARWNHNGTRPSTATRFFILRSGRMGLAPENARLGDVLCVIWGGETPLLIRKTKITGRYTLVGECYVHGLMHGETVRQHRMGEVEETTIHLE